MDEEVCLCFAWKELFCFRNVTLAVDIWIEVKWRRDNAWICLGQCDNSWSLERCLVAVHGIYCREMLVDGTAEMHTSNLHPYTRIIKWTEIF